MLAKVYKPHAVCKTEELLQEKMIVFRNFPKQYLVMIYSRSVAPLSANSNLHPPWIPK